MRKLDWITFAFAFLGLGALAGLSGIASEKPEQKVDQGKIAELVKQLGSDSFEERESASKELDAIGAPALEALKKAVKSDDAETQKRADDLVKKIEKRLETARLLEPTRIKLKYNDATLKEAVADLTRKTGYNIYLHDPDNKIGERKITLETAEITFWEAFDKFCKEAKLVEASPQEVPGPGAPVAPIPPGGGVAPPPVPRPVPPVGPGVAPPGPVAAPMRRPFPRFAPAFPAGTIVLMDGTPKDLPTCYSGAIRVRALPADINVIKPAAEEQVFMLEVTPEPKLQWQGLAGLNIEKAVDELGQLLAKSSVKGGETVSGKPAPVARPDAGPRRAWMGQVVTWNSLRQQVPARLKRGEKEAKLAKEVNGVVSAQLRTPVEPLITVDNILKAGGNTVKGDNGGSIKVLEASRDDNGEVKIRVEVEYPPEFIPEGAGQGGVGGGFIRPGGRVIVPGGGIRVLPAPAPVPLPVPPVPPGGGKVQIQIGIGVGGVGPAPAPAPPPLGGGGGGAPGIGITPALPLGVDGLTLLDEKGKGIAPVGSGITIRGGPGGFVREIQLQYKLEKDASAPAKLVFSGSRTVTVDIPFTLNNVPLQK